MPKYHKQYNLLSSICRSAIDRRGLQPRDFADCIGFSISHTDSLLRGARPWHGIERSKMRSVAFFLDISVVDTLLLAGILEIGDFVRAEELGRFDFEKDSLRFCRVRPHGEDAWILLPADQPRKNPANPKD